MDRSLVSGLAGPVEHLRTGEAIDLGDGEHKCIACGWAAAVRRLPSGERRVLMLLLPGDSLNTVQPHQARGYCATVCLTPIALVNCSALHRAALTGDGLGAPLRAAYAKALTLESAYLLEHVVRLGSATAPMALAHLILELYRRLDTVGMVHGDEMPLPVTQRFLAEMLSLTKEHMSRTLGSMQRQQIVTVKPGWLRVRDMGRLAQLAALC